MSRLWFTSDQHFGHANIIKYCARPFANVDEMNWAIVERYNAVVGDDDLVYHLGDVALRGAHLNMVRALRGRRILIKGNHDRETNKKYYEVGFLKVLARGELPWCVLQHVPGNHVKPQICGHVHEKWRVSGNRVNVGVDQWGFSPASENEVRACLP